MSVDEATLGELYGESYFRGSEYGDYLADRPVHRRNFERRLSELRSIVPDPGSVFEVGCAYGLWLELLTEHGIACAGVDISSVAVEYATRSLHQDATCGDFLTIKIKREHFETFCMWDTIEHLARPDLYVERIFDLLPPGGVFAFTTGNIESRYARLRGRRWRMIHPPTHLHYFSPNTARQLLERRGYRDVQFHSIAVYRNVHSVLGATAALVDGPTGSLARGLTSVLPTWMQERTGMWVNLGDIMFVSARKPPVADANTPG